MLAVDACSSEAGQGPEVVAAGALARTDQMQQKATPTSCARTPWLDFARAELTKRGVAVLREPLHGDALPRERSAEPRVEFVSPT